MKIHGATKEDTAPAQIGIIDTVIHTCKKELVSERILENKPLSKMINKKLTKKVTEFENSEKNKIRSVAIYYSGGVMGRRKYRKVYREMSYTCNTVNGKQNLPFSSVLGCPFPKILSYNKLMSFVKLIDIGNVYDVQEKFGQGLDVGVHGCYRALEETLLTLADFYLSDSSKCIF